MCQALLGAGERGEAERRTWFLSYGDYRTVEDIDIKEINIQQISRFKLLQRQEVHALRKNVIIQNKVQMDGPEKAGYIS